MSGLSDFERGQWDAFTRVLNLINTFDMKLVEKGELFDLIMVMRPVPEGAAHTPATLLEEP